MSMWTEDHMGENVGEGSCGKKEAICEGKA